MKEKIISEINQDQVRELIEMNHGRFFGVTFIKKDLSKRNMVARKKVTKHLKGGAPTYTANKNLVGVWEPKVAGYRCFSIDRVVEIRAFGQKFVVKG